MTLTSTSALRLSRGSFALVTRAGLACAPLPLPPTLYPLPSSTLSPPSPCAFPRRVHWRYGPAYPRHLERVVPGVAALGRTTLTAGGPALRGSQAVAPGSGHDDGPGDAWDQIDHFQGEALGFRVEVLGFRVQGLGFRVKGQCACFQGAAPGPALC